MPAGSRYMHARMHASRARLAELSPVRKYRSAEGKEAISLLCTVPAFHVIPPTFQPRSGGAASLLAAITCQSRSGSSLSFNVIDWPTWTFRSTQHVRSVLPDVRLPRTHAATRCLRGSPSGPRFCWPSTRTGSGAGSPSVARSTSRGTSARWYVRFPVRRKPLVGDGAASGPRARPRRAAGPAGGSRTKPPVRRRSPASGRRCRPARRADTPPAAGAAADLEPAVLTVAAELFPAQQ